MTSHDHLLEAMTTAMDKVGKWSLESGEGHLIGAAGLGRGAQTPLEGSLAGRESGE